MLQLRDVVQGDKDHNPSQVRTIRGGGMTWGDIFLSAMSVGYLCAAIAYSMQGNHGYGLALLCYAVANMGLIYAAR